MRLAFIADNDLPSIERDARFAHEQGFAGLEFNYWNQFKDLTSETIGQMRAILDKHSIRASMLGLWGMELSFTRYQHARRSTRATGRAESTLLNGSALTRS